jgi:hypothetical protein
MHANTFFLLYYSTFVGLCFVVVKISVWILLNVVWQTIRAWARGGPEFSLRKPSEGLTRHSFINSG